MNTRIRALLILFSLLCLGTSALMASTYKLSSAESSVVIIKKDQNGKDIRVRNGDYIQLELPALGSAGYSWHTDNLNTKYIEVIAKETKIDSQMSKKTGAPVVELWRFRAKNEGETELKLDYYRPWEGKDKSKDHFLVRLHIANDGKL
jgi:predicted secreted protein